MAPGGSSPPTSPEEELVDVIGAQIGFGRLMQLAEQRWRVRLASKWLKSGGEHTVGPCAAFMVPCPCPASGRDAAGHCEWCCGAGRVTERVLAAMQEAR